jgi:hypothetical protein
MQFAQQQADDERRYQAVKAQHAEDCQSFEK